MVDPICRRRMIIFDLDGTLADTRQDLAASVNAMRAVFGYPALDMATVISYVGNGLTMLVRRAFSDIPEPPSLETGAAAFSEHYAAHLLDETALYPGILGTLDVCRSRGYRLAVASNKPEAPTRRICDGLSITPFFDVVLGGDSCSRNKPDPEPLHVAMRQVNAVPELSWMVGDNYTDVAAAAAAGMKSCYCDYGFGSLKDLVPDFRIASPPDLLKLIAD